MRNFVAASCCLIVGLEILVGVPVAVCLGFLCFGSEFTNEFVVESPIHSTVYSSVPLPPPPSPTGQPLPTFDLYVAAPTNPSVCPAPEATTVCVVPPIPSALPAVASLPASDPAADPPPISQLTASNNESWATGTKPADVEPTEMDEASFLSRFAGQSVLLTVVDAQRLLGGGIYTGDDLPVKQACDAQIGNDLSESTLRASLLATANLLYRQADRHEANRDYDLSDRLRSLARDLRDEAASISSRLPASEPAKAEGPEATTATVGPPPLG